MKEKKQPAARKKRKLESSDDEELTPLPSSEEDMPEMGDEVEAEEELTAGPSRTSLVDLP